MRFIRTVFTSLYPAYLIRQYVFSGIITVVLYFMSLNSASTAFYVFLGINFFLYPFAMFVYDSLVALIMSDNVWITSSLFAILWGSLKGVFIYLLSIFIAPIGILTLYFKNR